MDNNLFQSGDQVYVIQRNPHTQSVAQIQTAHIVENPEQPGDLALFFRDEYYPLSDDLAIYDSYEEAEETYNQSFADELYQGINTAAAHAAREQ
ncbi:transcriptional regulator of the spore photoproduct lyase operon [Evansella caseinilytica]|uniref:Transcriptional regulator of the spore photoproduct lyase operon n=1 Tax=Evansella caseinilytica TaxID=1503961 RepID=A0A1H3R3T5_9BACI|nr:transcriptional regulator SplA domain-containing protein [Evansella caseinilytica]SDZ19975.1 transcriptional regulator of the spore photoproduct lyase operon [Evansella caseinilytica]